MSRRQLTRKQHAFLEYLQEHLQARKIWPTYREIVDHFEYRSPNSVTQNLQALARKGYLRRDRDGYHLIDRDRKDGSIAVRGTVRSGRLEAPETPERLSLTALFQDFSGLHALKLDDQADRTAELGKAHYVLVSEDDVPEGEMAVLLQEGAITLGRVGANGAIESAARPEAPPQVLGRYAGHMGPYGIVRRDRVRDDLTVEA